MAARNPTKLKQVSRRNANAHVDVDTDITADQLDANDGGGGGSGGDSAISLPAGLYAWAVTSSGLTILIQSESAYLLLQA